MFFANELNKSVGSWVAPHFKSLPLGGRWHGVCRDGGSLWYRAKGIAVVGDM